MSGTQTIKGDSNLVAGNIKKGISIFGISGTFTSDANATAANILSGKTAYVNGNKVTGSMVNRGNITNAVSSVFVEGGSSGTGLYVRISQGAYLTNSSSGYPEVFLPYNKIDPYRGQWQNTGGIGSGTDYIALNSIPNGFYYSQGASWAPEIRVNKDKLKDYVGSGGSGAFCWASAHATGKHGPNEYAYVGDSWYRNSSYFSRQDSYTLKCLKSCNCYWNISPRSMTGGIIQIQKNGANVTSVTLSSYLGNNSSAFQVNSGDTIKFWISSGNFSLSCIVGVLK